MHKQLQRFHLLVIDELGYIPFSKAGAEMLFEVISRADEHHGLMVTTNLAFEEWIEIFGSERRTDALLDRPDAPSWKRMEKAIDQTGQKESSLETSNSASLDPGITLKGKNK